MSGIAACVAWDGTSPDAGEVARLLDAMPHRGGPRATLALGAATLGGAGVAPWRDDAAGLLAIVDGWIAGEEDAARAVAAAYERRGDAAGAGLDGDFAAVLWDAKRGRLLALRDAAGARPLFHATVAGRLLLATEVEALLALPEVARRPDAATVLEFLVSDFRRGERTFIEGIERVEPGHVLVVEAGRAARRRVFTLPATLEPAGVEERARELRPLLERAVADRLRGPGPALVRLSSGLDSSSVVALAALARRREELAPTSAVTGRFPGLACDEGPLARAVAERAGIEWHEFDATEERGPTRPPLLGAPFREAPLGASRGFVAVAARTGARVLLDGLGGDELFFEHGAFRDLAAALRWRELLRETLRPRIYAASRPATFLVDALRANAPAPLRRIVRALRRPERAPPWLGPALRAAWRERRETPAPSGPDFTSHSQAATWRALTAAGTAWDLESHEALGAREGLDVRHPLFDSRVARFVLSLPFEDRLPAGRMKRLLRRAVADLLPPEVADARVPTVASDALRLEATRHAPRVREVLSARGWASEEHVPRRAALHLLEGLGSTHGPELVDRWVLLWRIASLELWLRRLG